MKHEYALINITNLGFAPNLDWSAYSYLIQESGKIIKNVISQLPSHNQYTPMRIVHYS